MMSCAMKIYLMLFPGFFCHGFMSTLSQANRQRSFLAMSSENNGLAGKIICQRSIYQLHDDGFSDILGLEDYGIEERTRFVVGEDGRTLEPVGDHSSIYLRRGPSVEDGKQAPELTTKSGKRRRFIRLGPKAHALTQVHFSENDSLETLQSSFATALLFASRPHWIKGNVMELACGSGLGGLLSCLAAGMAEDAETLESNLDMDNREILPDKSSKAKFLPKKLTGLCLTDPDVQILQDAVSNCATSGMSKSVMDIKELDWNDHISRGVPGELRDKYDVIIGSDVVSDYPIVNPLSKTVAYSLKASPYDSIDNTQTDGGLFVHVGPEQRERTLTDLKNKLSSGYKISCYMENLSMERFDLKPLVLDSLKEEADQMNNEIAGEEGGFVEYQQSNVFKFIVLSGKHNENYGGFDGEYFFPAETGRDDSPDLELDTGYNKLW